jgi:protein-L-isoaspartate O-methyltransferase
MAGPWNANIHYDGRLDACVPASATAVLDVGCGDGFLAARLARRVPLVVAIDTDAPVLDRAPGTVSAGERDMVPGGCPVLSPGPGIV